MLGPADGIDREAVESSNILSFGYDPSRQILAVEFKSGALFHYAGVGLEVATDFYLAISKGGFFAHEIKGKYSGEKMTGPCGACGANGLVGTRCTDCGSAQHTRIDRRPEPTDVDQVVR